MTMLNIKLPKKWLAKYSSKPISQLTPGTLQWYKYCQKIGRKEYLKKSREKTKRFENKHPGNLHWRVFKSTKLNKMTVSTQIIKKVKTKIEKYKTVRGIDLYITKLKNLEGLK